MAKLTNVISPENISAHVVEGYHFKVMSEMSSNEEQKQEETQTINQTPLAQNVTQQAVENQTVETTPQAPQPQIQPDFVEDLLKKTDEMSGNIIKLQMQIESQEAEFNNRLNTELEHAKEKFTKEGYEQAQKNFENELETLKEKYLKSVEKLENTVQNLNEFLSKNEKELADTAVIIAKEVIAKELEENSSLIALNLTKELMNELKNATKIELKLSPEDFEYVKSHLEQEQSNIKFSLDDAINKGSILILSDAGNIESNLNNRLQKIKNMANE
ncbi:flagellar assembly protein FliH [Campylobacter lari]|uniref:flagellar assembly protein FliH n=1 Tax=Campylobacter lari TaxID=201 RepID=UPI00127176B4|nr:flagellar assembly protein FliH [Campylobacter lari]EAK9941012.1 flagellar assembly protein FliH [Campylobacter lari]EAK9942256.1 flagellar assembly protein FliH [Campylobacter lari]EHJ7678240.1 flagellar assembly protein FliH [Campylobacter lari]EKN7391445.1 flagellar assembly protein FliH [Campylobacter lari]MCV3455729.1 flagellar assembly protein FliH [Campylobacter lari]